MLGWRRGASDENLPKVELEGKHNGASQGPENEQDTV